MNRDTHNYRGQSTIEFTFAMVLVALLIYGLIKIFSWVGTNYAQAAWEQQNTPAISNGSVNEPDRGQRLVAYTNRF